MKVEDTISTDKYDGAYLSGMEIIINESLNAIRRGTLAECVTCYL